MLTPRRQSLVGVGVVRARGLHERPPPRGRNVERPGSDGTGLLLGADSATLVDMLNYFRTVDTPTLCNAIELLKVRPHEHGFTPFQIRCLYPELGRTCGYAVTAQVETV